MKLQEIVYKIKIEKNNEYLNDLLNNKKIVKIINDILKWYKYNKEDVRDIICLSIIEYMNGYEFVNDYNEIKFLDTLKRKVSYKTKKIVNGTYKSKEIPFDNIDKVSAMIDVSLDNVEDKIDFQLAIKPLNDKEKLIFELYYLDGLNQTEIAEQLNTSQPRICEILQDIKIKIKNFYKESDNL